MVIALCNAVLTQKHKFALTNCWHLEELQERLIVWNAICVI